MTIKYNKDYTSKTAEEWFSLKKWTGFLMRLPFGRTLPFTCDSVREVLRIRATAGAIAKNGDRSFKVSMDANNEKMFYITANKKSNEHD